MIIRKDGLKWSLRTGTDDGLAVLDEHEPQIFDFFAKHLPRDGVFVDVGAHVGRYAVRMAQKCAFVVAVEPGIVQREALTLNFVNNGMTNFVIYPVAAWERSEILKFSPPPEGYHNGRRRVTSEGEEIQALPLDALLEEYTRVDVIKIDIEGAEGRALEGLRSTLRRCKPKLIIELHDNVHEETGTAIRDHVERVLTEEGYEFNVTFNQGIIGYMEAVPRAQ